MQREQTTIRLPPEMLERLRREAAERGCSFNGYIYTLILKGLEVELAHAPPHNRL